MKINIHIFLSLSNVFRNTWINHVANPTLHYNYFNTHIKHAYLSSPSTIHFGNDNLLCTCISLQHRHCLSAQVIQNTAKLPHTHLQTPLALYRQRNKSKLREYCSTWNYVAIRLVDSLLYPFFLIKYLMTWIYFQTEASEWTLSSVST